jgi:asparagine synthase (glutamine-hydrolysing)
MKHELFSRQVGQVSGDLDSFERYRQYYPTGPNSDLISRMMYTDLKTWLPDTYLEKVDKASMAVSLEARVPMLDHRLIEFMARLPGSFKVRGLTTKYLLRRAVRRLLPPSVLSKPKHGFAVPTDPWFRGELKDYVFDILMDERTRQRGYFNVPYVEHLYNMHREGKEVYDTQLWLLLNFELWARTFLDDPVQA